jgi:single-stranded DNA-specific DHH superfamily exonuclease
MPEISFQEAKEFLNEISEKDTVAIIHHSDGDGFCSGILYYDWCKSKKAKTEQFTFELGKTKLSKLDLKKFNKLIITDITPNFTAEDLSNLTNKQVLYADHHMRETPLPKEVLELVTINQGYIPSSQTAQKLTQLKPFLGLIGTITDKAYLYPENNEFIEKNLKDLKLTLEEFKKNISSIVTNFLVYFKKDQNKAFEILQKINSIEEIKNLKQYSEPVEDEIQKFIEEYETKSQKIGDINFYYIEPNFSIKFIVTNILSEKKPNEIFLLASPKKETGLISISARNENGKTNANQILKAGIKNLEKANAGGHVRASGGMIQSKDLEKFKENIKNFQA